ncbi:type ISP restriction/modification enzyme, partial [Streptomyces sp. NPDC001123]
TTGTVWLGEGSRGPVAKDVYDYSDGGKNILKSWFNYRKRNPGGKKTSPLDDITVQTWPSEWTTEFTDLLTVLTRVVDLQEDQEKLLNEILAGPLVSRDDLSSGTTWPSTAAARKPDYSRLGDPGLF